MTPPPARPASTAALALTGLLALFTRPARGEGTFPALDAGAAIAPADRQRREGAPAEQAIHDNTASNAADRWSDGAYGRLAGDVALSVEAGLALAERAAPGGEVHALYLATAGVYGSLAGRTSDAARWSVGGGVELRPLFLPRFLKALERGPSLFDLTLDSLALRVGARRGRPGVPPSLELGLGLELPLLAQFQGPFVGVRASTLWTHDRFTGARDGGPDDRALYQLTLGWRSSFESHLVDAGDEAFR